MEVKELTERLRREKDKPFICQLCGEECSALYEHGKLRICVNCKQDFSYMKTSHENGKG